MEHTPHIANLSVSLILWLMRGLCTLIQFMIWLVLLCKMVFDIFEKDFVTIAGLHEVFSGINFVEHDFGSTAKSCALTRLVMSMDRMVALSPYYLPVMPHFLNDSTRP